MLVYHLHMRAKLVDGALTVEVVPGVWSPKMCPFLPEEIVEGEPLYAKCGIICALFFTNADFTDAQLKCSSCDVHYKLEGYENSTAD